MIWKQNSLIKLEGKNLVWNFLVEEQLLDYYQHSICCGITMSLGNSDLGLDLAFNPPITEEFNHPPQSKLTKQNLNQVTGRQSPMF